MRHAVLALAPLLLAWTAATPQQPVPQPQPSPVSTEQPPGVPGPVSAPTTSPSPGGTPSSAPTASPVPATPAPFATPAYHFIYTPRPGATVPAADAPRIVEIDFSDQTIHQNSDVFLRVVTSATVASVVVSAMGHDAPVPQIAPGVWGAQSHVPSVPFFLLNRTYTVEVRAAAADGRTDSISVPVRLVR